ncbi:hypothetical protein J22TS1_09190 [Siminovitchia terrae]|uniref:hypothetical protein n=1 Tax=Siminovitchia terrae TaxID=1914933 RepID=UPI001B26FB79|nr:hypothetical protein [Siminovitchia terrae]GIN89868.1 hypothetical protein J22TS1_09190 [Siminovitchia terrae]
MEVASYFLEFQGIIGTLLGVALTLFTTHLLKNSGKVNFEVLDEKLIYYNHDKYGRELIQEDTSDGELNYFKVSFIVNLYNDSETPKPIKNILLELVDEQNKTIDTVVLKDEETRQFISHSYYYDELHYLNIMPKQLVRKELFYSTNLKDRENFRFVKTVNLTYQNERGKNIKINII